RGLGDVYKRQSWKPSTPKPSSAASITQAATPQIGEQVIVRARDYPRLHELSAADAQWVLVDASGPLLLLLRR
ncbi:MAG: hypothetical protein EBX64_06205, partial [Betaproteobacteria bacterium]|nr:hypothetical protein [Betaproteobacteria bacterium]